MVTRSSASEQDLSNRLGLRFKREQHTKVVGNQKMPSSEPIVTHSAKLPPQIAELVLSLHTPIAPNRLDA